MPVRIGIFLLQSPILFVKYLSPLEKHSFHEKKLFVFPWRGSQVTTVLVIKENSCIFFIRPVCLCVCTSSLCSRLLVDILASGSGSNNPLIQLGFLSLVEKCHNNEDKLKNEDNLKHEDGLKKEDNLKNENALKYEDDLKSKEDLKNKDDLKEEDNLKNKDDLKK